MSITAALCSQELQDAYTAARSSLEGICLFCVVMGQPTAVGGIIATSCRHCSSAQSAYLGKILRYA